MAKITVDLSSVLDRFEGIEERLEGTVAQSLQNVGLELERQIKVATPYLSGRLRGSVGSEMVDDSSIEVGVIRPKDGSVLKYAAIQEYGGTINGKPWLAIPLGAMKTEAGVPRARAGTVKSSPGQFGFVSTFILPNRKTKKRFGSPIIFGKRGGDGGIVPLFVLKKSVTIEGKGYVTKTVDTHRRRLTDYIASQIAKALGAA